MLKLQNLSLKSKISIKIIKIVIAIIILIFIGFLYAYAYLNKINYSEVTGSVSELSRLKSTDGDSGNSSNFDDTGGVETIAKGKEIINILLIGQDKRPGENRARSDAMIIASINKKSKSIKLISLMRDMYVKIPGYNDNKINSAYAIGGMELLSDTIENNFKILIEGCIEIDFSGFTKVIDTIGGIDIELNEDEAWYLNKEHNFNLITGINHLTGEEALEYSRIRYVGNDDYERTERQRRILIAAYNKFKDSNTKVIFALADDIFPLVSTNFSSMQILELIKIIMFMDISEIETYRIPADGEFIPSTIDGMSVLLPDLKRNGNLLKEYIGYNDIGD